MIRELYRSNFVVRRMCCYMISLINVSRHKPSFDAQTMNRLKRAQISSAASYLRPVWNMPSWKMRPNPPEEARE